MPISSCNKCGAIERSLAAINSRCFWCEKGTMKLKELSSFD